MHRSSETTSCCIDQALFESIRFSIQKQAKTQRQICLEMAIPHPIEQVWQLITDYENLTKLVPNLTRCSQVGQTENVKQIEFVGTCRIFNLDFSLRLVLETIESAPYSIETRLIEGDLRSYWGQWQLKEQPPGGTVLCYQAELTPKSGIPTTLLERQIRHLLPLNFLAIRQYLDQTKLVD